MISSILGSTHSGKAQSCQQCGIKFKKNLNIITNVVIHKCKRCEKYICINCGPENKKMKIAGYTDSKTHRVCTSCFQDKHFINHTLLEVNSNVWLGSVKQVTEQMKFQFDKDINDFQNKNQAYFKSILQKQIQNIPIREKYNASLKEYLYIMQSGTNSNMLGTQLYNIKLWAITMKYPDLTTYPEFDNFLLVLLALTKHQLKASFCLIRLIRDILPPNFLPKNQNNNNNQQIQSTSGMDILSYIVQGMILENQQVYKDFMMIEQAQTAKVLSFLSKHLVSHFIKTFMVNLVNIGVFYQIVDLVFKGGIIDPFIKAIIVVLKINLGNILSEEATGIQQINMTSMAMTTDVFQKEMKFFDQKVPNFYQQKQKYIQEQMQKSNPQQNQNQQQQQFNQPPQQNNNQQQQFNQPPQLNNNNNQNSSQYGNSNNINRNSQNNNNSSQIERASFVNKETIVLSPEEQEILAKLESVSLNKDEFNKQSLKGDICIRNQGLFQNEQLVDGKKIAEIIKNSASYTFNSNSDDQILKQLEELQPNSSVKKHYNNQYYQLCSNYNNNNNNNNYNNNYNNYNNNNVQNNYNQNQNYSQGYGIPGYNADKY